LSGHFPRRNNGEEDCEEGHEEGCEEALGFDAPMTGVRFTPVLFFQPAHARASGHHHRAGRRSPPAGRAREEPIMAKTVAKKAAVKKAAPKKAAVKKAAAKKAAPKKAAVKKAAAKRPAKKGCKAC
ncbi:MAG TPA: hypothetical protein PKH99_08505, partial [Vicinamibacterales bacterium]|nr:hypothetical protein [Vicinamibacterales bacterium]